MACGYGDEVDTVIWSTDAIKRCWGTEEEGKMEAGTFAVRHKERDEQGWFES